MTDLERSYRRLLRVYPAAWRAGREEELVGVLMAGTRDGQRRPGVREAADLVAHGLAARARTVTTSPASWSAASGIAGALLLLVLAAAGLRTVARLVFLTIDLQTVAASGSADPAWTGAGGLIAYLGYRIGDWPAWIGWVVVAGLLLAGRARTAMWVALGAVAAHAVLLGWQVSAVHPVAIDAGLAWVVTGLIATCTLIRPGPVMRVLATAGRSRVLAAMAVVTLLAIMATVVVFGEGGTMLPHVEQWTPVAGVIGMALAVVAILSPVVVLTLLLCSPAGRRAVPALAAVLTLFVTARLSPALAHVGAVGLPPVQVLAVVVQLLVPLGVFAAGAGLVLAGERRTARRRASA